MSTTSSTDVTSMTVEEIQAALAGGATAVDVTRAYLDRIAAEDGELGSYLHVDPEAALRAASAKFRDRFQAMERLAAERGVPVSDALWDEVKRS